MTYRALIARGLQTLQQGSSTNDPSVCMGAPCIFPRRIIIAAGILDAVWRCCHDAARNASRKPGFEDRRVWLQLPFAAIGDRANGTGTVDLQRPTLRSRYEGRAAFWWLEDTSCCHSILTIVAAANCSQMQLVGKNAWRSSREAPHCCALFCLGGAAPAG